MARISTYPTSTPAGTDLLIGTKDPNSLETKNFSVQSIVDLAAAGGGTGISLLTVGTSGVSTLTAGVLNIPNYTADPSIVKTTGNQTIGGAKTFITNIAAPNVVGNNTGDQSLSISGRVITISGTNSTVTVPSGGINTVSVATAASTGVPLSAAILNSELTLTSGVFAGGNNAGYVPSGGTNTSFLRGDGTWSSTGTVTSVGLSTDIAAFTVGFANPITTQGTITLNLNGGTSGQFLRQDGTWATAPFTSLSVAGTSGAATLTAGVLNIPNYTGASGNFLPLVGGEMSGAITSAAAANLIVQPGTSILEVKGDGSSVDGGIVLNCYANTHGQTLKSQPHSESITNTMLLPKGASSTLVSEATETGVTAAYSATAASTGSPLTPSIAGRALTLTSNSYQGGSNVGYVPTGGSNTTFLRGDGTWVTPTGGGGGGGGAVDSVNGATGTVVLNTGDIAEVTNLYYTEARVSANTNVTANTAKVGITTAQATDITNSVKNDTDTYTSTPPVTKIITLTQAEYTAITTPNVNTLYIII